MSKKQVVLVANIPDLLSNQRNSAVYNYLTYLTTLSERSDIDIHVFPSKVKSKSTNGTHNTFFKILTKLFSATPRLKKTLSDFLLIRKQKQFVKLLFEQYPNPDGILEFYFYGSQLYKEVKRRKLPYTLFYDCPVYDQSIEVTGMHSFYKRNINKWQFESIQLANQVIGYSEPVKEFLKENYLISDSKIRVFPTFIPDDGIGPRHTNDERNYIGFIGSFLSWHKVELLVEAFERVIDKLPESANLVLIGKGEEWENVRDRVARSSIKNRIVVTGYVSLSELREWRKKIRIGVMPGSNWYGSPLKLFEYLFAGIPFIAPNTPTVSFIFRDRSECLIIDSKNELDSLAHHLVELYSNVDLREELAANALNRMKTTFSEDNLIKILNRIVED